MQKVLQIQGGALAGGGPTSESFRLVKQGMPYRVQRVFLSFSNSLTETDGWYFVLLHLNGEGVEVGRSATTVSEIPSVKNCDEGHAHFFADVEFRSHLDGVAQNGGAGYSQLMTAPLGCDGWRVDTNDSLKVLIVSDNTGGTNSDITVGTIYFHVNFETPEKKE